MVSLSKSRLTGLILIAHNWLVKSLSCKHPENQRAVNRAHLVLTQIIQVVLMFMT